MPPDARTPETEDSVQTAAGWRARLTEYLVRLLVLMNLGVVLFVLVSYWGQLPPASVGVPCVVYALGTVPLLWIRPSRQRGMVMLSGLALTSATMFSLHGPNTAAAISLLAACVLTALLLGPRAGWFAVFGSTLLIGMAVVIQSRHLFLMHGATATELDPLSWLRLGLVWLACTAALVFASGWLTQRFESALHETDRALAEARREASARRSSEERRQVTETALVEAHRHETLGRFVGGATHDFNNAMFVILGWNDLLSRGEATPEQMRQAHRAIANAARNASGLAKRMVEMSRATPEPAAAASSASVVSEAMALLSRLLPEHIALETKVDALPLLAIAPMALQQIVFDLALAARDMMPEGGKLTLRLSAVQPSDSPSDASLQLRHEPRGAAMHIDCVLQEPSIAAGRAIAERAGGSLSHHALPQGAGEFTVRLPLIAPAGGNPERAPLPNGPVTGEARILLVEDDSAVRQVMVMALRARHFIVREAADGDTAMAMIGDADDQDELLCIDAILPGAPSAEIIARFHEKHPGCPVLICSGHVGSEALARLIQTERIPFLQKPFAPVELVRRVETLIGLHRQGQGVAEPVR